MQILIVESEGYSGRALDTYARLGPVCLGKIAPEDRARVSLLVVRLAHSLDKKYLSTFSDLKAIVTPTTGLTHIDVDECRRRDIRIFSLSDCRHAIERVTSTSELTIGLVIALLRMIPKAHIDVVDNQQWCRDRYRSRQLSRLNLGLVGLGRIGGHVAGYAHALGMRVLAFDPYQPSSRFHQLGVEQVSLLTLLGASDVVSIHANLREDNIGMLGTEEISRMRPDALLVNTARGALVDEHASAMALRAERLGGIAVDVLTDEHGDLSWKNSPLLEAARDGCNVIITPHIGGCTRDAMHITEECLADFVVSTMEGLK